MFELFVSFGFARCFGTRVVSSLANTSFLSFSSSVCEIHGCSSLFLELAIWLECVSFLYTISYLSIFFINYFSFLCLLLIAFKFQRFLSLHLVFFFFLSVCVSRSSKFP